MFGETVTVPPKIVLIVYKGHRISVLPNSIKHLNFKQNLRKCNHLEIPRFFVFKTFFYVILKNRPKFFD